MENNGFKCPHGLQCAVDEDLYEALRQSEARYRELVEHANAIILRWDTDGIITFFNEYAQKFFGYTEKEIIGRRVVGSIVPETESTGRNLRPIMEEICNNPKKYENNINENIKKNGERVWVVWTNKVIKDQCGNPIGALSIGADITERRELEHRLQHAEKMNAIGQLAGGMAHDFNNMLQGIMVFAELIRQGASLYDARRYAERIIEVGRDAGTLIAQLLAYARKGQYQLMQCDLHQIIGEVMLMLSYGGNKSVVINKEFSAENAKVVGDCSQLKSALLNIGLNALEAMPFGGVLTFTTRNIAPDPGGNDSADAGNGAEGLLQIDITDTGKGMSDAERKRIFEPFFTTKPIGKGTGMGLAATYGTVANHKGTIECDSVLGEGTRFRIVLPVDGNAARKPGDASEAGGAGVERLNILLVDDDATICGATREALQARGYRVTTFQDAAAAIEFYRGNWREVDVVILDMIMPGMGGDALYRVLKGINPDMVAFVATGHVGDGNVQALLDEGVCGYLKKPFTMDRLVECIHDYFGERAE